MIPKQQKMEDQSIAVIWSEKYPNNYCVLDTYQHEAETDLLNQTSTCK